MIQEVESLDAKFYVPCLTQNAQLRIFVYTKIEFYETWSNQGIVANIAQSPHRLQNECVRIEPLSRISSDNGTSESWVIVWPVNARGEPPSKT